MEEENNHALTKGWLILYILIAIFFCGIGILSLEFFYKNGPPFLLG